MTRLHLEICSDGSGNPQGTLGIPPLLLASPATTPPRPGQLPLATHCLTLQLGDGVFVIQSPAGHQEAPVAFGEWYRAEGWKLRITHAVEAAPEAPLVNKASWAAPEIEIETVDGSRRKHLRCRLPMDDDQELVVGRDQTQADMGLEDDHVSRKHLRFYTTGGKQMVEDLQSKWGTRLNGEALIVPTALKHGDELRLGKTTIRYICYLDVLPAAEKNEKKEPPAAPPAPPAPAAPAAPPAPAPSEPAIRQIVEKPAEPAPAKAPAPQIENQKSKIENPKSGIFRLDLYGATFLVLLVLAGLAYIGWMMLPLLTQGH